MTALLEFRGVTKIFGSTRALDRVDFDVQAGEVHALLGENGAGKSTALGLIYGVTAPDEGALLMEGRPVHFRDPAAARRAGIGCVFQELSLVGGLSVAENIFAGHPPTWLGVVDRARMREAARTVLASLAVSIDVDMPAGKLPVSLQQLVEIAKALTAGSKVLLLDEPTSALAPNEVDSLRRVVGDLKRRGIGLVYVSHHLEEVFEIADRITVLRDGKRISTRERAATSQATVIGEMVGGEAVAAVVPRPAEAGRAALVARGLRSGRHAAPADLTLRAGEITALCGLMGSGARELALAVAGLVRARDGEIAVDGKPLPLGNSVAARRAGIWFVPEERKADGLFLDFSVTANLTVAALRRFARGGLMREDAQRRAAEAAIARFRIRTPSPEARVSSLSGGNQQKVMLSRWLALAPRVLIVNEPTKGVDVAAKAQIHEALQRAASDGAAVLLVSSDFSEVLALADRVLTIHAGRITGELALPSTVERLMAAVSATSGREGIAA